LEREADLMGGRAVLHRTGITGKRQDLPPKCGGTTPTVQLGKKKKENKENKEVESTPSASSSSSPLLEEENKELDLWTTICLADYPIQTIATRFQTWPRLIPIYLESLQKKQIENIVDKLVEVISKRHEHPLASADEDTKKMVADAVQTLKGLISALNNANKNDNDSNEQKNIKVKDADDALREYFYNLDEKITKLICNDQNETLKDIYEKGLLVNECNNIIATNLSLFIEESFEEKGINFFISNVLNIDINPIASKFFRKRLNKEKIKI